MKTVALSCILLMAQLTLARQQSFVERPGELEFSGYMIARPLPTANPALRRQGLAMIKSAVAREYPEVDEYRLKIPQGFNENTYSRTLMESGAFQYVEPDWKCYPAYTPNDPMLGSQWHHTTMQSTAAWDYSFSSISITIAVTDTGCQLNHPDLAASFVPGYNVPSHLPQSMGGSVSDVHGHGTHVAGCAAAIGNNGIGVAGVAPRVRIMPIRITNDPAGWAYFSDMAEGARWAADNGARVISCSYSGVATSGAQTTGEYCHARNATYMYAAGNDSAYLNFDYPDVIVVGASDGNDQRASFSAYGPAIDVFAPGVGILSTTMDLGYQSWNGTSMATPLANGLCALLLSYNPNLTAQEVETLMMHGCKDLGALGEDSDWGWGRINAKRSMQLAISNAKAVNAANGHTYEKVLAQLNPVYANIHAQWRKSGGLNGHLASIEDASEQAFIQAAYAGALNVVIVGGFQPTGSTEPAGGWTWLDGTPWTYTNWSPGEPNNGNGGEAYMNLNANGTWSDTTANNDAHSGFIVEYNTPLKQIPLNVDLGDFATDDSVSMNVLVKDSASNQQSFTAPGGTSSVGTILNGVVQVYVSGGHWLNRVSSVDLSMDPISTITMFRENGDVDADNEIGPGDFGALSSAFGSVSGDANWNAAADLDGDGEVGPSDFGILSANFGLAGDPAP